MKSLVLDDIWIVLDYKYHRIFFVEEANLHFFVSNFNLRLLYCISISFLTSCSLRTRMEPSKENHESINHCYKMMKV